MKGILPLIQRACKATNMLFDCSKFNVIGRIFVIQVKRLAKHVETGHFRNHGTDQCFAESLESTIEDWRSTLTMILFHYVRSPSILHRLHLLLRWFHNARSAFDLCIS